MSELPIGPRRSARYRIIRSMEKELMGPTEIDERFEEYPSTRYIVGRLSPANEPIDAEEDDGLGVGCDDGEGGYDEKEMPLIMGFHPSSMGISFELDSNEYNLKVEVEWADYKFEEDEEEGGQSWRRYQRKGLVENIAINSDGRLPQIPLHPDSAPDGVTISGLEDKEITLDGLVHKKDDYQTVSLFLVNRRERGDIGDRTKDEKWIFQPKITIHDQNEQSIFSSKGLNNIVENEDPEIAEQDLLYRHAKVFATGHGVSADWEDSNEGEEKTSKIWTEFIPKREIPSLIALESQAQGTLLDMKELSQLSSGNEIYDALIPMLNAYKEWIEKQKQLSLDPQIQESVSLKDAANLNLELCEEVYKRMLRGLEHIRDNNNVAEAFKFSNEAMWRQRIQSILAQINSENGTRTASFEDNDIRKNRTWRPFQMGFFLINILGLSDPVDQGLEERKMVDLLWFPTGGGKTEAYLGISAFVLGLRRLKGDQDGYVSGAGTSIIMRYTLRLLTVQQFQRTTALVCACESIRRLDSQKWGQEPFQIGLWVGRNTTPNDFLDSRKALQLLSERRNLKEGSPVQILSCPWCGEQLSDIKGRPLSGSYSIDDNSARTIISCLNPDCEFCRRRSEIGIPAVVVDDEIYRVCPSIIIGTVDKFARLPFKGEIKSIFGRRNRYSPTLGHLSDADTKIRGRVVRDAEPANPLLPPELIIQDELHLISGPLGSIVGLYESAIDMLTQINGVSAKIIASTATIRRAKHQVRRLYNSGLSIFPQSGINSTDSFFAKQRVINEEDDNSSGRMFLGINAPGSSTKTLLVRVYSVLLASAQAEIEENSDVADPYGTLVGYFNSLKALGGAKRLVEDDIKNVRLRYLYNQRGFPRKNITEPDELTSRLKSWQIPALLRKLNRKFPRGESDWPSDVLLATNMISVGVDINRLGLMVVTGQPRSTSEYIQASSRVGREHPGLVITMYNWLGARDISHYEKFRAYHDAIYRHVESMSITPFSSRAIDRGIQGLMVGLSRMGIDGLSQESQAQDFDPADPSFNEIVQSISTRAGEVLEDQQEAENLRARMLLDGDRWSSYTDDPLRYKWLRENMVPPGNQRVLIKTAGTKNPGIWSALGSLRDVESQSAFFLNEFIEVEGEDQ